MTRKMGQRERENGSRSDKHLIQKCSMHMLGAETWDEGRNTK